jgi:hypothetical protein
MRVACAFRRLHQHLTRSRNTIVDPKVDTKPHYAQVLHDKRIQHGWKYGDHYFPHDITHRELASGKSRLQALAALGIDAVVVPQSNVLDGINVVRRMLGRTWISSAANCVHADMRRT